MGQVIKRYRRGLHAFSVGDEVAYKPLKKPVNPAWFPRHSGTITGINEHYPLFQTPLENDWDGKHHRVRWNDGEETLVASYDIIPLA